MRQKENWSGLAERLANLVQAGVGGAVYPGATWVAGTVEHSVAGAAGHLTPDATSAAMQVDTLFDIASLTKVVCVWPLIGWLVGSNRLRLTDRLGDLLPGMAGYELAQVSIFQLLTHTAALPARARLRELYGEVHAEIVRGVLREPLVGVPGTEVLYTDRAALILGLVIEQLTGQALDRVAGAHLFHPLGMSSTGYGPLPAAQKTCAAPTEYREEAGGHLRGEVHDYSTGLLGGVCGIAGLFSNVPDLQRLLRAMLAPTDGNPIDPGWVQQSLSLQTGCLQPARGLLWHPAFGTDPEDDVWCHLGFTGTAMWVSPQRGLYAALLTNKVYYSRDSAAVNAIRHDFLATVFGLPA